VVRYSWQHGAACSSGNTFKHTTPEAAIITNPKKKTPTKKVPEKKRAANQTSFKEGHAKYPGQGKRGPNKSTVAAREAIAMFVDGNAHRLQEWLDSIAKGVPPKVDPKTRKPIPLTGVAPNPEKAAALFIQVIEYHVPKLARTVHVGDPDEPVYQVVLSKSDANL